MTRSETHYNAIVGIINGELAVLDYTFEDSDNFKGVTGYRMGTITQDYIDYMKHTVYTGKDIWKEMVEDDCTTLGLDDWWKNACDEAEMNDQYFPFDDTSFRYKTNEIYKALPNNDRKKIEEIMGVKGTDYVDFDCSNCGRCFHANEEWDLILRPDLVALINKFES